MIWDDPAIAALTYEYDIGTSTAKIGDKLGCSKNAVVGKCHRLKFVGRPSPIIRNAYTNPAHNTPPQAQRGIPQLPPLESETPEYQAEQSLLNIKRAVSPPAVVAPPPVHHLPPPSPIVSETVYRRRTSQTCCWPIGIPGTAVFRFCTDIAVIPGRPYCAEHAKLAYVRVRDRREDAHA